MLLDDAIRECNEFVWTYMHPPGNPLVADSPEHIELVRTFFAGFMCGADAKGDYEKCLPLMSFFQDMTEPDWRPGPRFARPAEGGAS